MIDAHAALPEIKPPASVHLTPSLPITTEMLFDASAFTAAVVVFAIIAWLMRAKRARSVAVFAGLAVVMLAFLWALSRSGELLGDGMLFQIAREGLLALHALAVIRATLTFVIGVLMSRLAIPFIVSDVLLTLGLVVFALYRLSAVGVNLAGIVTTSAVITGAIAFSAQEILGALWAGLALQAEHSLRQGDWIRFGEKLGQVVHLRWRSTAIATCDHETIIIPNAALMKDKITLVARHGEEHFHLRRRVSFSVSYNNAPSHVTSVINRALHRAEIHNVAHAPPPFCVCKAFEDSGIAYEILYHIIDLHHYPETDSAVLSHVYAALARESMSIPFPHRVVQVEHDHAARAAHTEHAERVEALKSTALLASLVDEEREELAANVKRCPFAPGDIIFRQGDAADSLFVLSRGTLYIYREIEGSERRKLAELHAPAYFGEMGLLLAQPRGATVIAHTDALCYRVDRDAFDDILRNRPAVIEDLSQSLAQRQAENDATLQAMDAEARARSTRNHAAELMRKIRSLFGVGPASTSASSTEHSAKV